MKRVLSAAAALALTGVAAGAAVHSQGAAAQPRQAAGPAAPPTSPGPTPLPTAPPTTAPTVLPTALPTPVDPAADPALTPYYGQKITWVACKTDQCGELTVPLDYAKPDGPTIKLSLLKRPASGARQGALVVNPGGPGLSGVDFARGAGHYFGKRVQEAYDIVGVDPRGGGRSSVVTCAEKGVMDTFLGLDPTPDTPEEREAVLAGDRAFGAGCAAKSGPVLAHMSTEEAARDLDILRAALGDEKLSYFGASYGTFLGATYADLFPGRVRRAVLDGAMDPALTSEERSAGQAQGFERAFDAFAAACAGRKDCPLGTMTAEVQQKVRTLLAGLDAAPLPTHKVGPDGGLTQAWAWRGIASTLYDRDAGWPQLENALTAALKGNGSLLMMLATQAAGRENDGRYTGTMLQSIDAVNCLDRSDSADPAEYEKRQARYERQWPTLGANMAWAGLVCGTWPVPVTGHPHRVTAPGSAPIVVVGTTRDPATPYEQAVSLATGLANGRLITRDGDGHTGYHHGSACVDDAVDAYLAAGTDPGKDLRCRTTP